MSVLPRGAQALTTWRDLATCRDHPLGWWFPERPVTAQIIIDTQRAKAICAECPVAIECVADAMVNTEQFGIWGGLVPRRIAALRRAVDAGPMGFDDWRIGAPAIIGERTMITMGTAA